MKKHLLILTILCLYKSVAFGQVFEWAKIQGHEAPAIAANSSHFFSAATFHNSITLGNQTFSNPGVMSGYLAMHNGYGTVLWAKHIIGTYRTISVETDVNNDIILTGIYRDSLFIDSLIFKNPIPSSQWGPIYTNIFVAKFNPAGSLLWAKRSDVLVGMLTNILSIGNDGSGNIHVGGTYSNSITFNNTTINAVSQEDVFLVKYDQNGNFQWLRSSGASTHDQNPIVKCGINNDVYLKYLSHTGSGNALTFTLKKYNSLGLQAWSKTISGAYADGLGIDDSGNIYVSGNSNATLAFDNLSLHLSNPQNYHQVFLAKINPAGNWIWAKKIITGSYSTTNVSLGNRVNNKFGISGFVVGNPIIGNKPFTTGPLARFIGQIDTAGTITKPNIITQQGVELYTTAGTGIVSDLSGNSFLSGAFGGMSMPQSGSIILGPHILSTGTTTFGSNTFPWHSTGFITKVTDNANEVSGALFIDTNGNGIKDGAEIGFPNGIIEILPGPGYVTTEADGSYFTYLGSGTFNLNIVQPAQHYIISPQNQTIVLNSLSQTVSQNFALTPIPNRNDVKISVTRMTPARPGSGVRYRISYENIGTTTLSDSVILAYNSTHLSYSSSTAAPAGQQTGKVKWYYQALQPQEKRQVDVIFNIPTTTSINTPLTLIATIKPLVTDFNPVNNTDTLNHVVTASYDPNDKQVNKAAISSANEYLDYTIRFQNTGTDTAFTVIIRDTITQKLFMPGLELLSASHNYTFKILENNVAEWRFDNILLPDSNRNEPASHGFVRFRIKPQNYMQLGDSITNSAAIYFDYNAPIITNTAVTRIMQPLGIKEEKAGLTTLYIYPNPATELLTVEAELKQPQETTVILRNVLGQEVYRQHLGRQQQLNHKINIQQLPKGVYLLQLQAGSQQISRRVVVQ